MSSFKTETGELTKRLFVLLKWIMFALITGTTVGAVGSFVVKAINFVTEFRTEHSWVICFLPIAGVIIVFLYKALGREDDAGTNSVLSAIRSQSTIHLRTTPLIIISTILTHLTGGSVGREGAALQFGGSIGEGIGNLFHFNEKDRTIIIMCGMSAAFSAVFGVPTAAVIFPMEVASVGILHYSALLPCSISSFAAHEVAKMFGLSAAHYTIPVIESASIKGVFLISVLAAMCSVISIFFCETLHKTQGFLEKKLPNRYIRIIFGAAVVLMFTSFLGTDYNGLGSEVILTAVESGFANPFAFIIKIFMTAVTLGCGYKGGEIVPSFFIGATFGAIFGMAMGFSPEMCAALGMISVFCGVTNCPLASFLIGCDLFGFNQANYYLLVVGITYILSGYYSLYNSQKFIYSKTEPTFINGKIK